MVKRREYGSGSVYQRRDGKWIGAIDAGFTASGGRRRVTVTGRTDAEARRRLRDKVAEVKSGIVVMSPNTTVKAWADTWLPIKEAELSPKGYKALAGPVRKWVVSTIGSKRLTQLTPADIRSVEAKQREAGLKGTTCAATQRALFNMLRAAIAEGHAVPTRVLMAKMPKTSPSDRKPLSIPEALAVIAAARDLPHRSRWHVALLTGMRQGECLGLTWDAVDFDAEEIVVEWQLQRLPYRDKRDRSKGFRVPAEYDSVQVHKSWHLVRPKSKAGFRVYPLLPVVAASLREWREHAPDNPHGLVWPNTLGRPASNIDDLEEWHALQGAAGVGHPAGRYYHVHECRNVTATRLREAGVDGLTITSLLGHTSLSTSEGYMTVDAASKRAALEKVAAMLELG
ncbi:site-specific integrase [Nocardioides sp. YIM 152315]|uniref:tyrosine-type recombinase/integrase n=1 Tax=Nocardioides sp. YIM 152315 TaxID=3031760 RepID=UPI0023D9C07F|nr:site-specific integrase [Nocardioides sp. YIM 152315]MDF1603355.1 site-specific integrase [Nocardioides sp. YIM 152315]